MESTQLVETPQEATRIRRNVLKSNRPIKHQIKSTNQTSTSSPTKFPIFRRMFSMYFTYHLQSKFFLEANPRTVTRAKGKR
jgi:hypothetical protein